jgi:adenosylcobinamide-GDP ribazoletransferase
MSAGRTRERRPKLELRLFWTALRFYTRLPAPAWVGHSDAWLRRSTRYLPAVGWVVGGVVAGVMAGADWLWPAPVAVVLGLAAGVWLTGGLHEDGWADVCDGFGAGGPRQRVLDIMKDSRVGVYAILGLVLLFGVKITALGALLETAGWLGLGGVVWAQVVSRWCAVTIIWRGHYARDDASSKSRAIAQPMSVPQLAAATVWLLPGAAWAWWRPWWLLSAAVALAVSLVLARWFKRRLGGYTGDCLGAAQQLTETAVYLTLLALAGAGW